MSFANWMAGGTGRLVRIVVGVVIFGVGLYVQGAWGVVINIVGLVPILAGVFNFCLVAPLLGLPVSGRRLSAGV